MTAVAENVTPAEAGEAVAREYRCAETGRPLGRFSSAAAPEGVALPEVGERVNLGAGLPENAYWLGVKDCTGTAGLIVRILSGGRVREAVVPLDAARADHAVVGRAEGSLAEAITALATALTMNDGARREAEDRLDSLVEAAHEYASDNDLCVRFDEFMDRQGLPTRQRDFRVEVEVTGRLALTVSAYSDERAEEVVTREMVDEEIGGLSDFTFQVQSAYPL